MIMQTKIAAIATELFDEWRFAQSSQPVDRDKLGALYRAKLAAFRESGGSVTPRELREAVRGARTDGGFSDRSIEADIVELCRPFPYPYDED
jgi:hypothetical protein